ncbi:MAG: hypothetical protein OXI05_10140 [Bacteroidota bacterium]|nr:hypothetical protein [Bacteroidota bacterium]MXW15286.1 hypothetical protein [Rhodothermaceae bacterium]MDE2646178.1 hypothetical protein [Bacteroidota bacterium]MXW31762.1 hypothetical protein [Rhodothermaceae bacterium]MYC03207.1 hypothetical protein [Rhodothermaceae bacterium]
MSESYHGHGGHELFIVDNSAEGWTGLRYLSEWCTITKSFDIAYYSKIIVALNETIPIMGRIDEVIEAHGGWSMAFVHSPA